MKKITLLLCVLSFSFSNATIIVRNITDFTFTEDASLDFDFNSDGIAEFSFEEGGGIVGAFFNSDDVNFMGYGSIDSGYGWDVMKFLNNGALIGSTSSFFAEGDAYINPFWANSSDVFPAGDSYVGTKFKIGANTYYGWILINSTGGAEGTITVKSYAYNDVANASITAGQTLGVSDFQSDLEVTVFPNPTTDYLSIKTEKTIATAVVNTSNGASFTIKIVNNIVDLTTYSSGMYFLNIISDDQQQTTVTIIKK